MKRPHLIICDDLEDDTPLTEKQRESLKKWYKEMDKQPIDYDERKEWDELADFARDLWDKGIVERLYKPCWWCFPATCLFLVFAGMLIGEMLRAI